MIAIGRGGDRTDASYSTLRDELLSCGEIRSHLPDFVTTCRSGIQFWGLMKAKFAHYHERDQFVWKGFEPLFRFIEAEPCRSNRSYAADVRQGACSFGLAEGIGKAEHRSGSCSYIFTHVA
jgi:hypothetical protein